MIAKFIMGGMVFTWHVLWLIKLLILCTCVCLCCQMAFFFQKLRRFTWQ